MSKVQRTAVITGATSERGIGIDVARRYAREGWAVVVLDLDAERWPRSPPTSATNSVCPPSDTTST